MKQQTLQLHYYLITLITGNSDSGAFLHSRRKNQSILSEQVRFDLWVILSCSINKNDRMSRHLPKSASHYLFYLSRCVCDCLTCTYLQIDFFIVEIQYETCE